jgi:hypothetical protein
MKKSPSFRWLCKKKAVQNSHPIAAWKPTMQLPTYSDFWQGKEASITKQTMAAIPHPFTPHPCVPPTKQKANPCHNQ